MLDKLKCIIIDDDPEDREFLSSAISSFDPSIQCIEFKSCYEALETLQKDTASIPDYIFLDLNMPVMDGKEGLTKLKSISHLKDVNVIIYSTSSHYKDVQTMKSLDARYYMVKPYSINFLIDKLGGIFHNKIDTFVINHVTSN